MGDYTKAEEQLVDDYAKAEEQLVDYYVKVGMYVRQHILRVAVNLLIVALLYMYLLTVD